MNVIQVRPHMDLTFSNVLAHINTVYVLITKQSKEKNKDGGQADMTVWTNEEEQVGLQGPNLRLKVIPSNPTFIRSHSNCIVTSYCFLTTCFRLLVYFGVLYANTLCKYFMQILYANDFQHF